MVTRVGRISATFSCQVLPAVFTHKNDIFQLVLAIASAVGARLHPIRAIITAMVIGPTTLRSSPTSPSEPRTIWKSSRICFPLSIQPLWDDRHSVAIIQPKFFHKCNIQNYKQSSRSWTWSLTNLDYASQHEVSLKLGHPVMPVGIPCLINIVWGENRDNTSYHYTKTNHKFGDFFYKIPTLI